MERCHRDKDRGRFAHGDDLPRSHLMRTVLHECLVTEGTSSLHWVWHVTEEEAGISTLFVVAHLEEAPTIHNIGVILDYAAVCRVASYHSAAPSVGRSCWLPCADYFEWQSLMCRRTGCGLCSPHFCCTVSRSIGHVCCRGRGGLKGLFQSLSAGRLSQFAARRFCVLQLFCAARRACCRRRHRQI